LPVYWEWERVRDREQPKALRPEALNRALS